jgi:flavin reductase (DIM6/NTAB) family NADH-FMN oxidoreductase RutF
MEKVDFPINKHQWHPSLIPGSIVLISTYNPQGEPNIAPKSLIQMVSIDPSILMFSGTKNNTTENNILTTKCFTVNFIDSSMASKVYDCIKLFGQERIKKTGFTLTKASKINAPLVNECKVHLECMLHSYKQIGKGFVIFGDIIHASIWSQILNVDFEKRYKLLDQIIYLENGLFASINNISKINFSKKEYLDNLAKFQQQTR